MSVSPVNEPKGAKLAVFKLLAIAIPVLLLVILEVGLRAFNYGHNTSVFVPYPADDRFLQVNYYAAEKFFSDTINATHGSSEIFAVNKSAETVRIFVLGESTTIGYPYFHNGSFHRWLQFRLMKQYPGKNFEVVNLAMTALNSYAVRDFGKQLIRYEPDAVLIYTGHNEYYGAEGVGSTSFTGSNLVLNRLIIALREFKTVQLLNHIVGFFKSSRKNIDTRENLMKRMAANQQIQINSKTYQAGINQFTANMDDLCAELNKNHIPVFFCTVVSNQKDLPPFISSGTGSSSAAFHYKRGQLEYQRGEFETAKQEFIQAKELDELRFRAPEAINTAITTICKKYPFVHQVDVKDIFEKNSPHGIVGNETILEHVHPNLYGYALMSEAFYQKMNEVKLIRDSGDFKVPLDVLMKDMPIMALDSLAGYDQITLLKRGWPFSQPIPVGFPMLKSLSDSLAYTMTSGLQWKDAMGALYERVLAQKDKQQQLKIMEALSLEYPQSAQFCGLAASLNAELKNFENAAMYYRQLNRINLDSRLVARAIKLYVRADKINYALNTVADLPPAQRTQVSEILTSIHADRLTLALHPADAEAKKRLNTNEHKLGIADDLVDKEHSKAGKK